MVALVKRSKRIQSVTFEIKLFVLTFWKFLCGFNLWSTIHKYPTVQIFVKLKIYVKRIATWSERRAKTKLRYHLATIFWTKWHQTMIAHGATRDHKKFCTNKYKYKYKPKKKQQNIGKLWQKCAYTWSSCGGRHIGQTSKVCLFSCFHRQGVILLPLNFSPVLLKLFLPIQATNTIFARFHGK